MAGFFFSYEKQTAASEAGCSIGCHESRVGKYITYDMGISQQ